MSILREVRGELPEPVRISLTILEREYPKEAIGPRPSLGKSSLVPPWGTSVPLESYAIEPRTAYPPR